MNDKIFADGLFFKRSETAPDFVVGKLSVNADKFAQFISVHKNEGGYVNLEVKKSKAGGFYVELDTWQPKKQEMSPGQVEPLPESFEDKDLPF